MRRSARSCDLNGLCLIEYGLRRIDRQDEVLLVNEESRAKLVPPHRIVRVHNRVVLALVNRTENRDVAARTGNNVCSVYAPLVNRHATTCGIRRYWKIGQEGRDRE